MVRSGVLVPLTLTATLAVLSFLLFGVRFRHPWPAEGDTPAYLLGAWSLARFGVYGPNAEATPAIGREPGYAVLLALMMRSDTALAAFSPACLASNDACPLALYRPAQVANVILTLAAATIVGRVALSVTGWIWALPVAFGYISLNGTALSWRQYLVSDYLALCLVAIVLNALSGFANRVSVIAASVAGASLALLIFVKAAFLYLALLLSLIIGLFALGKRRAHLPTWLAFSASWACPVLLWMLRNSIIGGAFVFTDLRSGIALSTREVFNHMSITDNLIAFVYWTRAFGDGLARSLFGRERVAMFDIGNPDGYYLVGQLRYETWVAAVMSERGADHAEAVRIVNRDLLRLFLERPLGYLASMPALVWRGVWIDEFIVVGLPSLVWASRHSLAERRFAMLAALLPGIFNMLFYAAVSLNIPRYQMTALPSLAVATAWAASRLAPRIGAFVARRQGFGSGTDHASSGTR